MSVHDAVCRSCGLWIELHDENPCVPETPPDLRRLNPALLEELSELQDAAVRTLSVRMDVDLTEVLCRLVGAGLFVLGLDPAAEDDVERLVKAAVNAEDEEKVFNKIAEAACAAWEPAVMRERQERMKASAGAAEGAV